jgi:SAM-dependent methyltransferase
MLIDGIHFPPSALAYLRRHKPYGELSQLCQRQVDRARKQIEDLTFSGFDLRRQGVRSILDIGCGLAVVPALLARDLDLREVHLMDGDGTGERFADYREIGLPWNDVQTGLDMVCANVGDDTHVFALHANPAATIPVDMIMSLKSWGLHYPVATYMGLAARSLRNGGILVIDLHKEGEACAEIEAAGYGLLYRVGEYGEQARTIIPFTRHIFQRLREVSR